jgi:hypothetical protein
MEARREQEKKGRWRMRWHRVSKARTVRHSVTLFRVWKCCTAVVPHKKTVTEKKQKREREEREKWRGTKKRKITLFLRLPACMWSPLLSATVLSAGKR